MTDFERTVDLLKAISPSELVNRGIVSTAPNHKAGSLKGYICPLCNSGGRGGTGAAEFDDENRLYCHACENADNGGHKLSTIDLFARVRNVQHESFGKIVRAMADEFGIQLEEGKSHRQRIPTPFPPLPRITSTDSRELDLIRADLSESDETLKQFVESQGGKWRGLPIDILVKFGCRYVEKWTPPKSRVNGKFATPTPRIIVPAGEDFYLARFVGNFDDFDESTREFIEKTKKLNAGQPKLFNPAALDSDVVIAVEGSIDAMSLDYVGFNAVALNGRGNGQLLIDALAEKEKKPRVVILMDSDESGRKAAPKLRDELLKVGVVCCIRYLFAETTKTDANDILVNDGVEVLRKKIESLFDGVDDEFAAAKADIQKMQLRAGVAELFQGDGSDTDFSQRLLKFCGDDVRFVKDSETWLTFERNKFGGAVWTRGASNAAILPSAMQMSKLLADNASSDSERKIANAFKSSRKISAAISLLKGCEEIRITQDDMDTHGELLNVRNGVIDLTTGKLLQASPELLITQTAAAVYNPKCTDTTFAEFFKSVLPDDATRAAVSSYLGYCLTADVSAEKYLVIFGKGGNGKGVLLLTLRTLLGDYGCELPVDTVLENKSKFADANGRATTELTPLVNRRLGIVDELPRNGRLDVAKVNRLTGGDKLPIRELHHEYKDVPPSHKLILTGNFRPQIDDVRDDAILRRLIVVNFTQDFTKNPDVTLKKRLTTDAALTGALNILVPAAVEFYKRQKIFEPSPLMKRARDEFLGASDFIGDFLSEYYETGTGEAFTVKRKDLLKHLRDTCADAARYRDNDLITMIDKIDGVAYTKDSHNANIFSGIRRVTKKTEQRQGNNDSDGLIGGEIVSSADFCPPSD